MSDDRFQRGENKRRQVLGNVYVDSMLTDFQPAEPILDLVTAAAWGTTWSSSGLTDRERSLVTTAILAATEHLTELELHVKASRVNGVTAEELVQVALHAATYSGMPNGLEMAKIVRDVYRDATHGEDPKDG